jgi:hypothetical protein
MADMSDLSFNLLRAAREDFIRVDTLCAASNLVANFIYSQPIFKTCYGVILYSSTRRRQEPKIPWEQIMS